jgi:hypothetical protein
MPESFIVIAGRSRRELALSATDALRLVRDHMKLRRLGVRIEDWRGNPVTVFQLKALAEDERQERDC